MIDRALEVIGGLLMFTMVILVLVMGWLGIGWVTLGALEVWGMVWGLLL